MSSRYPRLENNQPSQLMEVPWLDAYKLKTAKVLVVGAGALGNEVIKNLVFSGINNITIVDKDRVEYRNLNHCVFFTVADARRSEYKVEVIRKGVVSLTDGLNIQTHKTNIEGMREDFIPQFDLVLGCVDNIEARLHINAHCYYYRVPYIDGGIDGFSGKVQVVLPPKTACVECTLNKTHWRELERRFSCSGERRTIHQNEIITDITTASIISALQVKVALKIISGLKSNLIKNIIIYNSHNNQYEELTLDINPKCSMHNLKVRG